MKSLAQLRQESAELNTEVTAKMAEFDAGRITPAAFSSYIGRAEKHHDEITSQINTIQKGHAWRHAADSGYGNSGVITAPGRRLKGRQANPLGFDQDALKSMHSAMENRTTVSVKAFSSVVPLIPAQLQTTIVGQEHENRILDHLPVEPCTAPSLEYIVHSSTTGAPAPTAEGAAKPELVLNTTSATATPIKLAAHIGISYESASDFPAFTGYAQNEMVRQIQDVENAQILSGSGTSGNMTGFFSASGILTHDASTDTGTGVTGLDSIEKSITALRTGSALAVADLIVMHPTTYSSLRRLKDSTGRMLLTGTNHDIEGAPALRVFDVPIVLTTACATGKALILDTEKFGFVVMREGLVMHSGQTSDDFTRNLYRFVAEERLALAVERPAAVMAVSNLSTS